MNLRSMLLSFFRKIYNLLAKTFLRRIPGAWNISNIVFKKLWGTANIIEVQGSKMHINVNDPDPKMRKTFQTYGLNLIHEEATTTLFKKIVKPGDIVLDLGANIGYFTLLAAKLVGTKGKVYAFEPEPNNFNYLRKNIDINGYMNVSSYQKAVSNKNGKARLFICPYDSGHHTINQPDGIKKYRPDYNGKIKEIEIDVVALEDFLKDKIKKINVAKVDVEGAEVLAFEGMRNILRGNQDIKIFLEFFPLLIEEMGSSPEGFIRQLQDDYEFSIFAIARDYSLSNSPEDYIRIHNYAQLMGLLQGETDHANLFLTRSSDPNQ
jgi:FkbM family methyltransferase